MSSLDYIVLPIDTDPIDVLDDAYSYMQNVIPGWTPSDGQLDAQILQSQASIASESRDVASAVSKSIFRWFGATVLNIQPIDATAASSSVTFTTIDSLGYTIFSGTQVGIDDIQNVSQGFVTVADLQIPPGSTTGHTNIVALIPGADGSNLGTIGGAVELLDPLDFISTVTLDAVTTGGVDAESDDDYLNRLSAELTLLAPRPILSQDFALFTRSVAGVYRAVAIDMYDPGPPPVTPKDRCVTIAAVDINGNAVSASIKQQIDDLLQSNREVNFKVFEVDPTYTTIAVTYNVKALAGQNVASVKSDVDAALTNYLNPATWGVVGTDPRSWNQTTIVRYLELAQAINQVQSVDYIVSFTFGIQGGAMGTADVPLTGVAPLVRVGTLTGTVT
jgi:hypothetical protein